MKWLRIVSLIAVGGCEQTTAVAERCLIPAEPTVDAGPTCTEDAAMTVLPAVSAGDVIVFCTACDVAGCLPLGEPCGEYGRPCDADGLPGVCVACCDGEVGELHCKPIE